MEARLVQLDFNAAFDRVSYQGLLYKLQSCGVGGSMLSIICNFLRERSQCFAIDGKISRPVNVVSDVPQGSVLGPLLFILYTSDKFDALENTLFNYADDSTLVALIRQPGLRTSVRDSLNRDLDRIGSWFAKWGMKLNPSKTKCLIVSRSRTHFPPHEPLVLGGSPLMDLSSLEILGSCLIAN
jgi:hypothetical protein